ncbi:MAG: shikimate kinase [Streptococcus sp.]|nr:shikimate kinase [Streptococcus sp.]
MPKILLGFMGSGKSTIANLLDKDFIDMDAFIEKRIGTSIKEFFEENDEVRFREIESEVLKELLDLPSQKVVATGGGVVMSDENRRLLRKNKNDNIFLDASFDVIYQRIIQDKKNQRPLFLKHSKEEFKGIFDMRYDWYCTLAGQIICVDNLSPNEIRSKIK